MSLRSDTSLSETFLSVKGMRFGFLMREKYVSAVICLIILR